ncbi:MAG: type II toxin-antitoxin system PemK/MazF family toxin [Azoarcus sp.]|jgi:mRNA interferase ChpB|nr:type II toxin-antitoxin system PemK/MazF family toxin [Azoarcus sp.]
MAYVPDRGDIIHLRFDPAAGREMKGDHFALVLSPLLFNRQGLAMVCPISQGAAHVARTHGTVVTLMGTGTQTQGAVHCHQLKSVDWQIRKAKLKESVPAYLLDEVMGRVQAILFD